VTVDLAQIAERHCHEHVDAAEQVAGRDALVEMELVE
jgi:hypothetical protein